MHILAPLFFALGLQDGFEPLVFGLELPVRDVSRAERLYRDGLGFDSLSSGGELARLSKDGLELLLVRSDAPPAPAGAAAVYLNLGAPDLALGLERALAGGFEALGEEREIPIGRAITLVDADGHRVNLIDTDPERGRGEEGSTIFNIGLDLEQDTDWGFVELLGFRVLTRAYLPDALPTVKAGAAELVLHRRSSAPRPRGSLGAALLLGVDHIEPALASLTSRGLATADTAIRASPAGRRADLRVPSGLRIELVERSPAQLAFEQMCELEGAWEGKSSAGWTSRTEFQVIARGSVVLERTNFEAHPGETMLTMYHRDGRDLVARHYCVAGNQPELVASELATGSLHFTFRRATNISSRDQGHMDEASFHFEGPDAFSSRWSWYEAGATRWMEEIRYRRLTPAPIADEGDTSGER